MPCTVHKREDAHMLLVLWDIDGTLVDSAGHGRHAFEEAFEAVVGGVPDGSSTPGAPTTRSPSPC